MLLGQEAFEEKDKLWFFTNDFDSLRLLAALQVAIFHGIEHLNHSLPHLLYKVLGYVPGVPIFFFSVVISSRLHGSAVKLEKNILLKERHVSSQRCGAVLF